MMKLEQSEALKRLIRKDDIRELGKSGWDLAIEAIRAGRHEEAISLINYERDVFQRTNDSFVRTSDQLATRLARIDEGSIGAMWRERHFLVVKHWLSIMPGVEESLQAWVELHRGHQGTISITEDKEKYVVTLDPCGSGGRLRRNNKVATIQGAYPWTWSKAGVPVYCTHCCIPWEICATELRGYPIKVALIGATDTDSCVHYFYKKPEFIPEEYFTRIGMKKPAKFAATTN